MTEFRDFLSESQFSEQLSKLFQDSPSSPHPGIKNYRMYFLKWFCLEIRLDALLFFHNIQCIANMQHENFNPNKWFNNLLVRESYNEVLNNLKYHSCHQVRQKDTEEKTANARKSRNRYYTKSSMLSEQVTNFQYQPLVQPGSARGVMLLC